jgi:hypothetical protein
MKGGWVERQYYHYNLFLNTRAVVIASKQNNIIGAKGTNAGRVHGFPMPLIIFVFFFKKFKVSH